MDKEKRPIPSILREIFGGSLAGIVARMIVAPFDVLKIRYQIQFHESFKYKGIVSSLIKICREENIWGLWKGNIAGLYLYAAYGSSQFACYNYLSNHVWNEFFKESSILADSSGSFFCGACAGMFATGLTYPLDLIRTRLSISKSQHLGGMIGLMKSIYKSEYGLKGFFRGVTPAMIQIAPYIGLNFTFFHRAQKYLYRLDPGLNGLKDVSSFHFGWRSLADLMAGAFAGVLSKSLVMPLDVIKRRLQVYGYNSASTVFQTLPTNTVSAWLMTGWNIVKSEGPLALFRGLSPAICKSALGTSVTFFVHEYIVHYSKPLK